MSLQQSILCILFVVLFNGGFILFQETVIWDENKITETEHINSGDQLKNTTVGLNHNSQYHTLTFPYSESTFLHLQTLQPTE
jgi:hypothetical protein